MSLTNENAERDEPCNLTGTTLISPRIDNWKMSKEEKSEKQLIEILAHSVDSTGPVQHVLINSDIDKFSWDEYTHVTLNRCVQSIIPELVTKSKLTLRELTFSDFSLFKNIKRCLKHFPNISSLIFSNVIIDAYHRFLYTKVIEVTSLKRLIIQRQTKLTNSEYFLLDFFIRGASLTNLEEFQLIECELQPEQDYDQQQQQSDETENEIQKSNMNSMDINKQNGDGSLRNLIKEETSEVETPFLARFLAKHHSSLKKLKIVGRHINVLESSSLSTRPQNLKLVQLEDFYYSMDDPGQHFMLEHQTLLKSVSWEGSVHNFTQDKLSHLLKCVSNNYESLTSVRLIPTIQTLAEADVSSDIPAESNEGTTNPQSPNSESPPDGAHSKKVTKSHFVIDCQAFHECKNLKTLEIHLKMKIIVSPGCKLVNLTALPPSLVNLTLVAESFSEDFVQFLADHVWKFQNVVTFHLQKLSEEDESTAECEFSDLEWLHRLCELPKIANITIITGADASASNDYPKPERLEALKLLLNNEIVASKVKIRYDGLRNY